MISETFHTLKGHVHPLFWPALLWNLILFFVRNREAEATFILLTDDFGRVRIGAVFDDPQPDWRDEIWMAARGLSPAGVRLVLMPATVSITKVGTEHQHQSAPSAIKQTSTPAQNTPNASSTGPPLAA